MDRFNYPTLEAAENEDGRILAMLEAESWGRKRDEQEESDEQIKEAEDAKLKAEADGQ